MSVTNNQGAAQVPALPLALIPFERLEGLTREGAEALAWQFAPFDSDRRAVLAHGLRAWVNSQEGGKA